MEKLTTKHTTELIYWYCGTTLHVSVHDALRNVSLPADPADVGTFTRVGPLVDPQRRPLGEPLSAEVANERFLTGVHPLVLFQLLLPRKALGADFAGVRFVTRVNPPVKLQLLLAGEPLSADITEHRGVHPGHVVLAQVVPPQAGRRSVMFVADGAVVLHQRSPRHYLPVLGSSVRREEPREHKVLAADLALEGLLSGVEVLVLDGVSAHGERLLANLAFVLGGTLVGLDVHLYVVLGGVAVLAEVTRILIVVVMVDRVKGESHIVGVGLVADLAMDRFGRIVRFGLVRRILLFLRHPLFVGVDHFHDQLVFTSGFFRPATFPLFRSFDAPPDRSYRYRWTIN